MFEAVDILALNPSGKNTMKHLSAKQINRCVDSILYRDIEMDEDLKKHLNECDICTKEVMYILQNPLI